MLHTAPSVLVPSPFEGLLDGVEYHRNIGLSVSKVKGLFELSSLKKERAPVIRPSARPCSRSTPQTSSTWSLICRNG